MTDSPQPTEAQELAATLQHLADLAEPFGTERTVEITITGPDGLPLAVDMAETTARWIRQAVQDEIDDVTRGIEGTAEDDMAGDVWGV